MWLPKASTCITVLLIFVFCIFAFVVQCLFVNLKSYDNVSDSISKSPRRYR